jgi:hypothetical protein
MPDKGTVNNMTSRIVTLMRECGVRIIMIDEFQHFYDKERKKVMHSVADWFKVLVDRCKVALVVSGLPSCQAVLNQNEQLAGRFLAPIHMPRFDWSDDDLRGQFIDILECFHSSLDQFELPALDSDEMAFRFYCASGGLIGYVVKILRQAVWNAMDSGSTVITLQNLACAYRESIYKDEKAFALQNPFDEALTLQPSEELLCRTRMIGTSEPIDVKAPVSRKKTNSPTVGEVLHT